MLPPRIIVTNKKLFRNQIQWLLSAVVIFLMAGCIPSGPRALLQGKRLLDEGNYAPALEKLKIATTLMETNAQAWNYLGLAYHHSARPDEAAAAYQKALKLNHDLVAAHYNLGCLWLEQNKLEGAKNELTAFTLHQGNSFDGWLKLGATQLRLGELGPAPLRPRELGAAEKSFGEALRISAQDPEALNDLGVAQLQLHRQREAITSFNAALRQQPNYGPALLNLATVSEVYLKDRPLALRKYREYLALRPRAANWETVYANAQQLDRELSPPARPATNNPVLLAANVPATPPPHPATIIATSSVPRLETNQPKLRIGNTQSATPSVAQLETNQPKPESASNPPAKVASSPVTSNPPPKIFSSPVTNPVPAPPPAAHPQVVQLPDSPVLKVAEDPQPAPRVTREPPRVEPAVTHSPAVSNLDETVEPPKRGFFRKLNPMNLFHHDAKPPVAPAATPLPSIPAQPAAAGPDQTPPVSTNADTVSKSKPPPAAPEPVVRYAYSSPPRPAPGNRIEAESALVRAAQAQREHHLKEAMAWYRKAVRLDPAYFDAQSGLALAAYESGEMRESLAANEAALALEPASFTARFNFALALKKAGYIKDAAAELERVLTVAADVETPTHLALAHLTLANLYADQFHQVAPARSHYLKVLELDPKNPQATTIRYWLRDNP
jgi:tetratricopeptide (TPR) repeat protein